jgi:arginyl-tRNA synthetase
MRERLLQELRTAVVVLLRDAGDSGEPPAFAVEPPRLEEHGDFACNAALLLGRRLRRSPREIAEGLVRELGDAGGIVARAQVAGPGFVNLWISDACWREELLEILREGVRYGRSDVGAGDSVQVEFVSANPTGPLTLGHGRQAVLGDSIARLLESQGFLVTRESSGSPRRLPTIAWRIRTPFGPAR